MAMNRMAPDENGSQLRLRVIFVGTNNTVQCFRSVGRQEGLPGLYRGLIPHIARSIPSAVIALGVYEAVLRVLAP